MELGPEPPHRRRLLFTCSPTPAPQPTGKVLFGASAAGGLSPVTNLTVTMDQLEGLGRKVFGIYPYGGKMAFTTTLC